MSLNPDYDEFMNYLNFTGNSYNTQAGNTSKNSYSVNASIFSGLDIEGFEEKINEGLQEDSENSVFYQNIYETGIENSFDYFDKNGDGVIDEDELNNIAGQDNNTQDISEEDMSDLFNRSAYDWVIEDYKKQIAQYQENQAAAEQSQGSNSAQGINASTTSSNGNYGSTANTETSQEKLERIEDGEIPELEKQRQEIIDKAEKETQEENEKLDDLLEENQEALGELQGQYSEKQNEIEECDKNISEYESKINNAQSEKFGYESTLANLESELSSLNTNTGNEEVDSANEKRKEEIESQIDDLKSKIEDLEKEIKEYEESKQEQEDLKAQKQEELKEIQEQIAIKEPELANKIQEIQDKIAQIEENKNTQVADIDKKIEDKRAEAIECQKELGTKAGKSQSASLALYDAQRGQALADTATSLYGSKSKGNNLCATGVADAIEATYGYRTSGNGCDYGETLSQLDDWVEITDSVSGLEDIQNLPAGAIVSWSQYDTDGAGKYYGHVYICDGNGHGISDFNENITGYYLDRNSKYRVFIPTSA